MNDRKRFSKAREDSLWRLVDKEVTDFRIAVLKGRLTHLSATGQEESVYKALNGLSDKVAAKYRAYIKEPT